jgi:hypothetical protein
VFAAIPLVLDRLFRGARLAGHAGRIAFQAIGDTKAARLAFLALLTGALVLGVFQLRMTDDRLIARDIEMQKRVGDYEVNTMLYSLYEKGQLAGGIAGNYAFLGSLPHLKERFRFSHLRDVREVEQLIEEYKSRYLIVMPVLARAGPDAVIAHLESRGRLKLIFEQNGHSLFEITD